MKKCFLFLASFFFSVILFSCASSSGKQLEKTNHVETVYEAESEEAVAISVPQKERSFFSGVDKVALDAVEKGSPSSLKQACSILRNLGDDAGDNGKVLLYVAKSVSQMLWPSDSVTFELENYPSQNQYVAAIESAKHGVYDTSMVESDFLSLVLPSIVLVVSESRSDYYELSKKALDSALEKKSDSVMAWYLRGILAGKMGDWNFAGECFKKACAGEGECEEILYALSDSFFHLLSYDQALFYAEKILAKKPFHIPALKICAESTFASGKLDECELYVAKVLQQEPENAYYVLFRAKILMAKGDYIRAASLLDVYARTDSSSREYLVLRTKIQKDWNKNMTGACATIEKALSLYPDDSEIMVMAATLASGTGGKINGKSAMELADIILQKDSQNIQAMQIQIEQYVQKKKWKEAYEISSRLCAQNNVPVSAIYDHISICLESGKKDEAWNLISPMYEKNPKDEQVVQNYIKSMISTGRKTEAQNLIQKLLQDASSKMKSFLYYQRSFLSSSEDSVLMDLRSSLTANPRNKDALFRLYQIYFEKKEYRKAQYYLKQVVALSPGDESLLQLNRQLEEILMR